MGVSLAHATGRTSASAKVHVLPAGRSAIIDCRANFATSYGTEPGPSDGLQPQVRPGECRTDASNDLGIGRFPKISTTSTSGRVRHR